MTFISMLWATRQRKPFDDQGRPRLGLSERDARDAARPVVGGLIDVTPIKSPGAVSAARGTSKRNVTPNGNF